MTTLLLAIDLVLGLTGLSTARASFGWFAYQPLAGEVPSTPGAPYALPQAPLLERALDPALILLVAIALLFLWSVLWPRTAPWGVVYRRFVQPRLAAPTELEDPRPPRFAQGIGFALTTIGVLLDLLGVPWALPIAVALALMAAFLNAVFGLCLGCRLYVLMQRAGLVGRRPASPRGR